MVNAGRIYIIFVLAHVGSLVQNIAFIGEALIITSFFRRGQ